MSKTAGLQDDPHIAQAPAPQQRHARPEAADLRPDEQSDRKELFYRRLWLIGAGAALLITAIVFGTRYLLYAMSHESTDDAFIQAHMIQISPKVSGYAIKVHVRDNQEIKKGDLLVEIDPRDYQVRLDQARAALDAAVTKRESAQVNVSLTKISSTASVQQASARVEAAQQSLQTARAQLEGAQADEVRDSADVKRYQELYARDEVSRQQLDRAIAAARNSSAQLQAAHRKVAEAEFRVDEEIAKLADAKAAPERVEMSQSQARTADAEIEQLQAKVKQAQLELSYTKIYAPESGRVTRKTVEEGAYLQPGQVLFTIVPNDFWVIANFKETQLARMRPGQHVRIRVDAYPDKIFNGHVDSIQAGSGAAFSLLPPENATGNYVKVVQRVPVKILIDDPPDPHYVLGPGMSVVPEVNVG